MKKKYKQAITQSSAYSAGINKRIGAHYSPGVRTGRSFEDSLT